LIWASRRLLWATPVFILHAPCNLQSFAADDPVPSGLYNGGGSHTHTRTHPRTHTHIHTHTYIYTHKHTHIHTHIHIHTQTHTHTHTKHTHTYKQIHMMGAHYYNIMILHICGTRAIGTITGARRRARGREPVYGRGL